jgi:hypothetical protein
MRSGFNRGADGCDLLSSAPPSPEPGYFYFHTGSLRFRVWDGSRWLSSGKFLPDVFDSFNRANTAAGTLGTTDVGSLTWAATASTWQIQSNRAIDLSSGSEHFAVVNYTSDVLLQLTVAALPSAGADGGLIARATDVGATNCLLLNIEAAGYTLYQRVANVYTSLGAVSVVAPAVGDVLRITAVGMSITASVNGVYSLTVTNSTGLTNTYHGMRSSGSSSAHTLAVEDFSILPW